MRRKDANAVVTRAVLLERPLAGPVEHVAARHRERIGGAITACSRLADDVAQPVCLDDAHHRLAETDSPAAGHEDDMTFEPGLERLQSPLSWGFVFGDARTIRSGDDRGLPGRRLQGLIAQIREKLVHIRIAPYVEDDRFGFGELWQRRVKILLGRPTDIKVEDCGLELGDGRRPRVFRLAIEWHVAVKHDLALCTVEALQLESHLGAG